MSIVNLFEAARARLFRADGFVNRITGYGTSRDHGEQFRYSRDRRIDSDTLEAIYAEHEIAHKIIDFLPDAGTREWIEIDDDDHEEIEALLCPENTAYSLKPISLQGALNEAEKMARLHGWSAVFFDIDDGQEPDQPLNMQGIREIVGFSPIEGDYLQPVGGWKRSLRHELWEVTSTGQRVHASRLRFCWGADVPRDWIVNYGKLGQSVLQRCFKPLIAYSLAHSYVPNILKDFVRDIIKLEGFNEMNVNDCDDAEYGYKSFKDRMDGMMLAESLLNKTVLDTRDEFVRNTTNVTGLTDLIRNPERRLVAASGIPHTLLLGESPGGTLSQGGTSQEKDWHKAVDAYQQAHLKPVIDYAMVIVQMYLRRDERIKYAFRALDVPSQKEQAETYKLIADAAARLVDSQIISEQEAATHFEGSRLKTVPVLDDDEREAMNNIEDEGDPTDGEEER